MFAKLYFKEQVIACQQKYFKLYKSNQVQLCLYNFSSSRMGGCVSGKTNDLKDNLASNPLKNAAKAVDIGNLPNQVPNPTTNIINNLNDVNPNKLPAYRFDKDIAATVLKPEDIVPNLYPNIEVSKLGQIKLSNHQLEQIEQLEQVNQIAEAIDDIRKQQHKSKIHKSHKDAPEKPQEHNSQNPSPAKSHLSEDHNLHPIAKSPISSQFQPKLQKIADTLPISNKQAVVVSSILDLQSIRQQNQIYEKYRNSKKADSAIQENINNTVGKLPALLEESEIVNDENVTNHAVPINFKLEVRVQ